MSLAPKQIVCLQTIRRMSGSKTGYPGVQQDLISTKIAAALHRDGLIEQFIPVNPIHKERWVITPKGREALDEATP